MAEISNTFIIRRKHQRMRHNIRVVDRFVAVPHGSGLENKTSYGMLESVDHLNKKADASVMRSYFDFLKRALRKIGLLIMISSQLLLLRISYMCSDIATETRNACPSFFVFYCSFALDDKINVPRGHLSTSFYDPFMSR